MGEMTGFGRATMHVLDATGDTKIMWNPRDKDETKNAKETFKRLADKGFQAFRVNAEGAPGERISEFDKNAEKDKTYRIRRGWAGNIDLIEDDQIVERWCVHPARQIPVADSMVAQKLMIESGCADELRGIANVTAMRRAA